MPKWYKNRMLILFAGLFLLAVGVRVLYLTQYSSSPIFRVAIGPDVEEYDSWAREIIAGQRLWPDVRIHAPLYPYFLAGLYWISDFSLPFVRGFQLFIGLLAGIPLFLALRRALSGTQSPAKQVAPWIFAFLWAVYPPLIYYQAEIISESLMLPLLSLSVYFLYRADSSGKRSSAWFAIAGFSAGLAVLTHPLSIFFLALEIIFTGWNICLPTKSELRHNSIRHTACLIAAATLILTPVIGYNMIILQGPPIQANSGFNLWLGNGPGANGTCRLRPGPEWDKAHLEAEIEARQRGTSKDRYFLVETGRECISHPFRAIRRLAEKFIYTWNFRELTAGADLHPLRYFTAFIRWGRGAFAFVGVAALALMLYRLREGSSLLPLRHFMILGGGFWIGQTIFVTSGRYRVGMLPMVLAFAAVFLAERRTGGGIRRIIAILVAALIVFLPKPPLDPQLEQAEADSIIGEALLRRGHPLKALVKFEQSALHMPAWSRHHNLIGLIHRQMGRPEQAALAFSTACAIAPEEPDGWMNLAILASERGDSAAAGNLFKRALELSGTRPGDELCFNYALFLHRSKKFREAGNYYRKCLSRNPAHRLARNNLGAVLILQNRAEEAAAEFLIALRLKPGDPGLLVNLTLAYIESGNTIRAKETFNKLIIHSPEHPAIEELRKQINKEVAVHEGR